MQAFSVAVRSLQIVFETAVQAGRYDSAHFNYYQEQVDQSCRSSPVQYCMNEPETDLFSRCSDVADLPACSSPMHCNPLALHQEILPTISN